jgi:hypothetical protein
MKKNEIIWVIIFVASFLISIYALFMNIASNKKEQAFGLINLQTNQINDRIKDSSSLIEIYEKDPKNQYLDIEKEKKEKHENQIQSLKDLKKSYEELNIWSPCTIIKLIKTDPTKEISKLIKR